MSSTIDSIDLHVRSYRSALKSTLEVTVNSLTNSQLKMESILHPLGSDPTRLDSAAFIYSLFRLPHAIDKADRVIVGQNPEVFSQAGFSKVDSWPRVFAASRRRTNHYQASSRTLAVFAASISDIDDLTNLLIAYQCEWNKFHDLLHQHHHSFASLLKSLKSDDFCTAFGITPTDWHSLTLALGTHWKLRLKRIYSRKINLRLRLLAGSWVDYTKTVQRWWKNIAATVSQSFHISHQQIYFISSNNHSLLNVITGYPLKVRRELIAGIKKDYPQLWEIWQKIQNHESFIDERDFLYFVSKYFLSDPLHQREFLKLQQKLGILTIPNSHYLDTDVQIFPVSHLLDSAHLDSRLQIKKPHKIRDSQALIFNINYPLGFASYHILSETLENILKVKGVYILGKAAVLNSEIGDIEIPRLVFDEHTQNSYMFKNCFNTYFPFTNNQGSILTNQKSVTVLGTFLENEALLDTYSKNNLTVIEMESGPFLNAITEATYDQQTPRNTIVDLNSAPFDIGIINYTSDTPYSKAKNLGSSHLTLNGVEPVYLGSLAILQRIIDLEEQS